MQQGYDSPGSIILRCVHCGSRKVRASGTRWYRILLSLGLLRPYWCEACRLTFVGFIWQRPEQRNCAGMTYMTVCDGAELLRLMTLRGCVNDQPLEGVAAGALTFEIDAGRRVAVDTFEAIGRTSRVLIPNMIDGTPFKTADLTFLESWERLQA